MFNAFTPSSDPFFRLLRAVDGPFAGPARDPTRLLREPIEAHIHVDETDEATTLMIDLPSVDEEDIELELTDDGVKLSTSTSVEVPDGFEPVRRERRARQVAHTIRVGHPIDAESVGAELHDGVLTIRLPRLAPARRTIPIQRAKTTRVPSEETD
jgi:HSP20 family protein